MTRRGCGLSVFILLLSPAMLSSTRGHAESSEAESKAFQTQVESDWAAQEKRKGRSPSSPEAIRDVVERTERLLEDFRSMPKGAEMSRAAADEWQRLRGRSQEIASLDEAARLALYKNVRAFTRQLALRNPLIASRPIVFMKRRRFICQMLHEYLGYYYDYENIEGGGVYVLEKPGYSAAARDLVAGRLPRGNYSTLALSYDARTIYFAFCERAPAKTDFYSPDRRSFHLFAMNSDGTNLRQLTQGPDDDFDPCPLPDGGIAFMSTRRGGFVRCNNPWEPLPTYTLHRMDASGANVRTLSFHETSEWHPSVLNDGRIVYTRWDYVDRSAANFHGLWTSNPDGSNPIELWGSYTTRINACYQPRAIPGSNRILFIAGAHHADVGGSLVILDPRRVAFDPNSGENQFDEIERLTPEVTFPEGMGWPKSYFHSPWPLSENYFLASFSFDPLPGMGSGVKQDTETGIYLMDRFGNLELLYREAGIGCMYPIPLAPRPTPPVISSTLDPRMGDEGEFLLTDLWKSLFPFTGDRLMFELRVYEVLPKSETHIVNKPRLGYANAESARMLLGSVPVEIDSSAYFRVPARKPLYFQVVDMDGRAVQTMRSVTYVQPGERRGCVGCHEPRGATALGKTKPMALNRPPSRMEPGPDGTKPWSYPRLVQPILDRRCVRCHDGTTGEGKSKLALTGEATNVFSRSYDNLKPYVRWYEWGGASISQAVTYPRRGGADESRLTKILDDSNHGKATGLTDEERLQLYLWLDGNASFYGTYSQAEQAAQKRGEAVPPPTLQ